MTYFISEFQLQEEIGKLLRFESSLMEEGKRISLPEYCSRFKDGQKDIYYLAAPKYLIFNCYINFLFIYTQFVI